MDALSEISTYVGKMEGEDEMWDLASATALSLQSIVPEDADGGGDIWGETHVLELLRRHVYAVAVSAMERDKIYRRVLTHEWLGGVLCKKQRGKLMVVP